MDPRYRRLNEAFGRVLDEFSLVSFVELDITDEDSIENVVMTINNSVHYGDDLEGKSPRSPREVEEPEPRVEYN